MLLAQQDLDLDIQEIADMTEEKIELAGINPFIINNWHLGTVDQAEEFYDCCDELGNYGTPPVYEALGRWWANILRELMEKKIAHLGELVTKIPAWQDEQAKTRRIFAGKANEDISLREWYKAYFKLNVDWLITHKTGVLSANLKRGDVLASWEELNEATLPFAVDYAGQVTLPQRSLPKADKSKNPAVIMCLAGLAFILCVGISYYLVASSKCEFQPLSSESENLPR